MYVSLLLLLHEICETSMYDSSVFISETVPITQS